MINFHAIHNIKKGLLGDYKFNAAHVAVLLYLASKASALLSKPCSLNSCNEKLQRRTGVASERIRSVKQWSVLNIRCLDLADFFARFPLLHSPYKV